jgi:hypothetical protein
LLLLLLLPPLLPCGEPSRAGAWPPLLPAAR